MSKWVGVRVHLNGKELFLTTHKLPAFQRSRCPTPIWADSRADVRELQHCQGMGHDPAVNSDGLVVIYQSDGRLGCAGNSRAEIPPGMFYLPKRLAGQHIGS